MTGLIVCLLFQNACTFHASGSVAFIFYPSIAIVVFAFDKFINSHGLLMLLFHTNRYPYVTGTSVIALKYKDGVIMACDTGG